MQKKLCFGLIVFVLFSAICSAKSAETNFTFSLEPQLSISYEKHGEYLLYDSKEPSSYLDWQFFPIIRSGIKTGFQLNHFFAAAEIAAGIPVPFGKMNDSDWNNNGLKYIYSENDAKLLSDFNSVLQFMYEIPFNRFELFPSVQISYAFKSFKAYDGHGWYGNHEYSKNGKNVSWDDENAKYYAHISGSSSYVINNFFTFIGCYGTFIITPKIKIGFGTYISPYTYIYTSDHHYKKSGEVSKYAYALQNAFFNRFKEELNFNLQLFDDLTFKAEVSSILGGKAYGEYAYYTRHPLFQEDFYLPDKGISASDLYTISINAGFKKIF